VVDPRGHRQHGGQVGGVELGEEAHRLGVALRPGRPGLDHGLGAEVLQDQEALREILAVDLRRREAERPESPVEGYEGVDALGEVDDGRIGLAVAHRRPVGPGRGDHQHRGGAVGLAQALIGPGRGVPLHQDAFGVVPAGPGEELAHRPRPVDPGAHAAEPLDPGEPRALAEFRPQGEGHGQERPVMGRHLLRPLDQGDRPFGHLLEAEFGEIVRIAQAVEVGVDDGAAVAGRVGLDEREGRARHLEAGIARQFADDRPGEGRLAVAEPPREGHPVPRQQDLAEEQAEILRGRLVGQHEFPGGGRWCPLPSSLAHILFVAGQNHLREPWRMVRKAVTDASLIPPNPIPPASNSAGRCRETTLPAVPVQRAGRPGPTRAVNDPWHTVCQSGTP